MGLKFLAAVLPVVLLAPPADGQEPQHQHAVTETRDLPVAVAIGPQTNADFWTTGAVPYNLNAADDGKKKRTGRQRAGTWLLLIGTGAMLVGYLDDTDPNCPPAVSLSLGSTCYQGGNDELIIGGGALAATGLILALRGSKGESQGLALRPAGTDNRGVPTGLSLSYSIRLGGQRKTR